MRLYSPVDLTTGNVKIIEKLVLVTVSGKGSQDVARMKENSCAGNI